MIDLNNKHVEFLVRDDDGVVWVNIDGVCVLRVSDPKSITVDNRKGKKREQPKKSKRKNHRTSKEEDS